MPSYNIAEVLQLLRDRAFQATGDLVRDLSQTDLESLQGQLLAAAENPLGGGGMSDVETTLQALAKKTAEVKILGVQAEQGLGQLGEVFAQLGLENEPLLRQPEQEKGAPKLYIDPVTGTVVEGRIAGRLPQGQILNAVTALAEAKGPVSQSYLSRLVFGEKSTGKEPWLRSRFAKLNGQAGKLELPDVVDSPDRRTGYVLGPDYEVIGARRTFYPQAAPAQVEPLPGVLKKPSVTAPKPGEKFFYGATVTERTGIPQTALDLMGELGVLQEGVHYAKRGERNIRVYTEAGVTAALDLARFAKKEGQRRFTERLVRDAFGISSEQHLENPYGENGPKTVDDGVEYFLLQTAASCLPALRRTVSKDILAGRDEALRLRLEELKVAIFDSAGDVDVAGKRRLAAATASDLINPKKRRPFNFLLRERPGLALVRELIDQVKAVQPDRLNEFPEAVINPPSSVPHVGFDGRVNGSHRQGPLGDIR